MPASCPNPPPARNVRPKTPRSTPTILDSSKQTFNNMKICLHQNKRGLLQKWHHIGVIYRQLHWLCVWGEDGVFKFVYYVCVNAKEATAPSPALRGRGQDWTVVGPVRALLSFPSPIWQKHMVDQFSEEAPTSTDEQLPISAWPWGADSVPSQHWKPSLSVTTPGLHDWKCGNIQTRFPFQCQF